MNNPGIFKIVLGAGNQKLSAQSFKKVYSIVYSGKGSNDKDKEDKKIYCLDLYLQDLEEEEVNGVTLEDLLVFTTGADTVPLCHHWALMVPYLLSFMKQKRMWRGIHGLQLAP